jgi:hypothetical protein
VVRALDSSVEGGFILRGLALDSALFSGEMGAASWKGEEEKQREERQPRWQSGNFLSWFLMRLDSFWATRALRSFSRVMTRVETMLTRPRVMARASLMSLRVRTAMLAPLTNRRLPIVPFMPRVPREQ